MAAKNIHPPNEPIIPPFSILNAESFLSLIYAMLPITAKITGKVESNPLHAEPICSEIKVTNIIKLVTNTIFIGSSHFEFKGFASIATFNFVVAKVKANKVLIENKHATKILTGKNNVSMLNKHHTLSAINNDFAKPHLYETAIYTKQNKPIPLMPYKAPTAELAANSFPCSIAIKYEIGPEVIGRPGIIPLIKLPNFFCA